MVRKVEIKRDRDTVHTCHKSRIIQVLNDGGGIIEIVLLLFVSFGRSKDWWNRQVMI